MALMAEIRSNITKRRQRFVDTKPASIGILEVLASDMVSIDSTRTECGRRDLAKSRSQRARTLSKVQVRDGTRTM